MNVCVTGGAGFIAWYLNRALAAAGHHITILDLVTPGEDQGGHRFVRGDVRNPQALREAFAGCEAVYHLAAAHHDFGISEATFDDVNIGSARAVCQVMDELGIRQLVFYSTVAVYGDAPEPLEETTTPLPLSPYGRSKLAAEQVFRAWTEQGGGRRCLVIRPTVTFGPRNFANMYSLIRQVARRRFVFVGPADNIKSLSYVENIVDATLYLSGKNGRPAFDVYNYVEKPDFTSRQIASTIYEALGRRPPRWGIPLWMAVWAARPFDLVIALTGKNIPISSARVKKLFRARTKFEADRVGQAGFRPRLSLREGIERMVKWYVETGRDQSPQWHLPPPEIVREVES